MTNSPLIDLSHPTILEDLTKIATFDSDVKQILNTYTQLLESGELTKDTPTVQKLSRDIYYHLTTARNRNLITNEQQQSLRHSVGGFFGMSTGSHAVTSWIIKSRAEVVKIIDPDFISPTNLNRLSFGWDQIGQNKVDVVETLIHKLNPYAKVIKTTKTDNQTTKDLFIQSPKLDFVIEAIDDLSAKIKLRLLAKEHHIPLIMATDVGDNVFIDVERYDLNPQPQLFNGRIENAENLDLNNLLPPERLKLAMQIVGLEHNSLSMLESLSSIGKTIPTWPQLGSTAIIAGGTIATIIKKIIIGEKVLSGRYYIDLDELFVSDHNSSHHKIERQNIINKILSSGR